MALDDRLREIYRLGKEAFHAGRYGEAKEYFLNFIEEVDNFADVYNMLGVISQLEGNIVKAKLYLEKALAINPKYVEAALNLAIVYSDMGEYEKARNAYEKAKVGSRVKSGDRRIKDNFVKAKLANLHAQIADIYAGLGLYEDAIQEYQKALKLQPTFADIRNKLGMVFKEVGRFDEAVKELEKAVEINPDYLDAMINLGLVYYAKGEKEEAKKMWLHVIKKDPTNQLAKLYYETLMDKNLEGK